MTSIVTMNVRDGHAAHAANDPSITEISDGHGAAHGWAPARAGAETMPRNCEWARLKYAIACDNHWSPQAIPMTRDAHSWKDRQMLTSEDRRMAQYHLSWFVCADNMVATRIALGVYRQVTAEDCRHFLLRQAFAQTVHAHAYRSIAESLGVDARVLAGIYAASPAMRCKLGFLWPHVELLHDPGFRIGTAAADEQFLTALVVFGCVAEGVFSDAGFAQLLSLACMKKLPGLAMHCRHIMRDRAVHWNFWLSLVHSMQLERPQLWGPSVVQGVRAMIARAVALEDASIDDSMPSDALRVSTKALKQFVRFVVNKRLARLGLQAQFPGQHNPFPWLEGEPTEIPRL